MTDGDGNKTTSLFDDSGNIGEVIDPLGQVTRYAYDSNNDVTQVLAPLGITYTYTYDANGISSPRPTRLATQSLTPTTPTTT